MTGIIQRARRAAGRALMRWRGGRAHAHDAFAGSAEYWQQRYLAGGDSGAGSYGKFAAFKARVLNGLFTEFAVGSVIEFGCGDGNQLAQLVVADYVGVDVSPQALQRCRERYAGVSGRRFMPTAEVGALQADAALSLDVVYHLVEDDVFNAYMRQLFGAARRLVVVYASNFEDPLQREAAHVRHREFTRWVAAHAPAWQRVRHIANEHPFKGDWRSGSFADFHVFTRDG